MNVNAAGRAIIETYETLKLEAYRCPAGVLTIGYGHTGDVKPGDKITAHQADVILEYDLSRFAAAVAKLAPRANQNQFAALVCLAFNIGTDALAKSTLLRKFNAGAPNAAAAEFAKWTYADGKSLPGLVKRRAAEAALFLQVPS